MVKLDLKYGLPFCKVTLVNNRKSISLDNVLLNTGTGGTIFKMNKVDEIDITIEEDDIIERISGVDSSEFAYSWVNYFYDNEDIWPVSHRKKSQDNYRKYDYDIKQKSNLFNIDSLYRKMPKKSFVKGRKQELEILMMYYWIHSLVGDEDDYWQEYLNKALLSLK